MKISLLLFLILSSLPALAKRQLGISASVIGDSNSISANNNSESTYADAYFYFQPVQKWNMYAGLEYNTFTYSGPDATNEKSFSSADNVMLSIRWTLGKSEAFFIALGYGVAGNAIYQVAGRAGEAWTGTAMAVQAGLRPQVSKSIRLKGALTYITATYKSKSVGNGTPSSEATSLDRKTYVPTFGIEYEF